VTLRSVATLFFRLGNTTFGGGDAMTAVLQRELVTRRRWLSVDQYVLAQSLAKITPGTGILAFCAATAWMLRGGAGALAAVLAVSVPSSIIVVALTSGFTAMAANPLAAATLAAILASAVGMMWAAAWLLAKPQMTRTTWLRTTVIFTGAIVASARWSISPIQVIAVAALLGALWTTPDDAAPE
jgi:chromate transporter